MTCLFLLEIPLGDWKKLFRVYERITWRQSQINARGQFKTVEDRCLVYSLGQFGEKYAAVTHSSSVDSNSYLTCFWINRKASYQLTVIVVLKICLFSHDD